MFKCRLLSCMPRAGQGTVCPKIQISPEDTKKDSLLHGLLFSVKGKWAFFLLASKGIRITQ